MANPYGTDAVNSAYNTGKDAVNSFDPNAWSQSTGKGYNDLFAGQQKAQGDYIQSYKDAISANPSAQSLYNTSNEMFNVPALRQNANQLNNAMLMAPNQTLDSAKGFNYDNNQVQNQTNLTLARLSPLASAAQNNANTASGLAQGYVQAGMAQNQQNLLPVQQQGQMLNDLWARQTTGFTTTAEGQLNGLIQKMQSGVSLSQSEMSAYAQLAAAEEQYNATINAAKISQTYKTLGPTDTLLNTATGRAYNPFTRVGGM